jgi:hypothetical protein
MTKRGDGALAGWARRWFVLVDAEGVHEIRYYTDDDCQTLKGYIDLGGVKRESLQRVQSKSSDYLLQIQTAKRKWQLNAGTEAELAKWEGAIVTALRL